jgi:hypothetical protein
MSEVPFGSGFKTPPKIIIIIIIVQTLVGPQLGPKSTFSQNTSDGAENWHPSPSYKFIALVNMPRKRLSPIFGYWDGNTSDQAGNWYQSPSYHE